MMLTQLANTHVRYWWSAEKFFQAQKMRWWFFSFDTPLKAKEPRPFFRPSKITFSRCDLLTFGAWKEFSTDHQYLTCVFASCVSIISIRKNNPCHLTTTQSDFTSQNVSWWWFSSFDAPSRAKLAENILQWYCGESTGFWNFLLKNGLKNFLEVLK